MKSVFQKIFATKAWGRTNESVSGPGSALSRTETVRSLLPRLIKELAVRTLLDVPCGDWNWMRHVDLSGVTYIGGDIVDELVAANRKYATDTVEFRVMDVVKDKLPCADLVLVRDCLVHLPNSQALAALKNIAASGSQWLLTTTFAGSRVNQDIAAGKWRPLNLQKPPFSLAPPTSLFVEELSAPRKEFSDRSLGLWRLNSLWPK